MFCLLSACLRSDFKIASSMPSAGKSRFAFCSFYLLYCRLFTVSYVGQDVKFDCIVVSALIKNYEFLLYFFIHLYILYFSGGSGLPNEQLSKTRYHDR